MADREEKLYLVEDWENINTMIWMQQLIQF